MSIDKTNIKNYTQSTIDSLSANTENSEILSNIKSIENLTSNFKNTIILGCDLPDLSSNDTPEGTVYYVEEFSVPVVASDNCWLGFDGRIYRDDTLLAGLLYSWARNTRGNLGTNDIINYSSPVQEITSSNNWKYVSVGSFNTHAIKSDGTLWGWGRSDSGELGDENIICRSSPVQEITSSTNWSVVEDVGSAKAAIKEDGSIWLWGQNIWGQLGDDTNITRSSPVQEITSSCDWVFIGNGSQNTFAIKTDGTLWGWGVGSQGRLAVSGTAQRSSPIQEGTSSTNWAFISSYGQVNAIKTDGTLWGWGCNTCGQTATNDTILYSSPVQEITSSTNWSKVKASFEFSTAIKTDGTLWSMGKNDNGQLGDNTVVYKSSPVQEISSSTNWCSIGGGSRYTGAIKTDGTLWSWGCNGYYSIGDETVITRSSPVQEISSSTSWFAISGMIHTSAIKTV